MADDQASSNEVNEGGEAFDPSYDEETSTAAATAAMEDTKTTVVEYDDNEPIEDYVVNLVVNEQPEGATISTNLVDAAITDIQDNMMPSKTTAMIDAINDYSSTVFDELSTNTAAITGGKRWWGWSTQKILIVGLIAVCILAIILVLLFVVLGKKFKKNKKSTTSGTTNTPKAVVTKGVSPDPKYQPVPNV